MTIENTCLFLLSFIGIAVCVAGIVATFTYAGANMGFASALFIAPIAFIFTLPAFAALDNIAQYRMPN